MTHTKEPWATTLAKPRKVHAEGVLICTAVLRNSATTAQNRNGKDEAEALANARRIVSCVNAFAGIPDPAAYVAAMAEVERLSSIASRWHWNGTTEEAGGYDDKDDLFQDLHTALQSARAAKGDA